MTTKMKRIAFLNTAEVKVLIRNTAKQTLGLTDNALLQCMFGLHSLCIMDATNWTVSA